MAWLADIRPDHIDVGQRYCSLLIWSRGVASIPVQNFLIWQSGSVHRAVMRAHALFPYIPIQRAPKDPYILYFDAECTEGDDNERVAETRDHRVRGWHGSDKLPSGRVGPRLIPSVDLT